MKKTPMEDTPAWKAFIWCPVPGLDLLVGGTVAAVDGAARLVGASIAEGAMDAVASRVNQALEGVVPNSGTDDTKPNK